MQDMVQIRKRNNYSVTKLLFWVLGVEMPHGGAIFRERSRSYKPVWRDTRMILASICIKSMLLIEAWLRTRWTHQKMCSWLPVRTRRASARSIARDASVCMRRWWPDSLYSFRTHRIGSNQRYNAVTSSRQLGDSHADHYTTQPPKVMSLTSQPAKTQAEFNGAISSELRHRLRQAQLLKKNTTSWNAAVCWPPR